MAKRQEKRIANRRSKRVAKPVARRGRDDFGKEVRRKLAERAGYLCSNPDCRLPTCGPHSDPNESVVTGDAAHICAAAKNGPRYDPNQTSEQRKAITNGIWLCARCNRKVDRDWKAWPAKQLQEMKAKHESWIEAQAMIPGSPDVSLTTLRHLRIDEVHLPQITADIAHRLREQELVVENRNRVEIYSFVLDLSLPEFVERTTSKRCPVGIADTFRSVQPDVSVVVQGRGASATSRPARPTPHWRLEIDKLPALSQYRQAFLTIAPNHTLPTMPYQRVEIFGDPEQMHETKICHFYLEGNYTFLMRGEFVQRKLFVPLFFKVAARQITSLDVQETQEPWKVQKSLMRSSGFTLQVGGGQTHT